MTDKDRAALKSVLETEGWQVAMRGLALGVQLMAQKVTTGFTREDRYQALDECRGAEKLLDLFQDYVDSATREQSQESSFIDVATH